MKNREGALFTTDRAAETLTRQGDGSAEQIAGALRDAVDAWGPAIDDVMILVCKRVASEGGGGKEGELPSSTPFC